MILRAESVSVLSDAQVLAQATADERVEAFHSPWPEKVTELHDRAREYRRLGEHIGAGDLEREAAAIIDIAQDRRLLEIVSSRLGLHRRWYGGWVRAAQSPGGEVRS